MMTRKEYEDERRKAGLHHKYIITHSDGSPCDPTGEYFVLKLNSKDPIHRQAARRALTTYADSVEVCNQILAHDLRRWLIQLDMRDRKAGATPHAGGKEGA